MKTAFFNKAALAIAAAALVAASGAAWRAAAQAAPAGVNLYQDVLNHQSSIKWVPAPDDNYPDGACGYLDACSADRSAPKQFALAPATIDGHKTGRAVYLVKVKDPKNPLAVVLEHQTTSATYFFRVAPDGTISKSAYLERGGNWLLIANQLGQPVFNKDIADWHAALTKPAAAVKPAE